jgi:hypothetical protein
MKLYLLLLCSLCFFSCAQYRYFYKINLDAPVQSSSLTYGNDTFSIVFDFTTKGLSFELFNRSNEGIKINWDEVSISENGVAKRVIHKETGMTKINDLQPPTTIPPQSSLKDFLVPSDNVKFYSSSGRTTMFVRDAYPIYDKGSKSTGKKIMQFKGSRFILYLPLYIRNNFSSKTYEFTIVDIERKKTGAFAPKDTK